MSPSRTQYSISSRRIVGLAILLYCALCLLLPLHTDATNDGTNIRTSNQTVVREGNKLLNETTGGELQPEFVAGEVLVKFKNPAVAASLISASTKSNGQLQLLKFANLDAVLNKFAVDSAVAPFAFARVSPVKDVIKISAAGLREDRENTKELLAALRSQPEVEYAELNLLMRTQTAPDDTYYSSSGAWSQAFRDLWGLQSISAESAWNVSTGENIVVAVSDTGVDYNHEDIAANIAQNAGELGTDSQGRDKRSNNVDDDANGFVDDWHGYDFVTFDGTTTDNDPMDDNGHGTHVAGTIGAVGNNAKGIIGVAYRAKILPVKGLNSAGFGSNEDLAKTILYAADNGAKVINASWGEFSNEPQRTLIDAVNYAHDTKGVLFVAAAGNNNGDVGTEMAGFFPACIRNAMTVSAVDHNDNKAYFSNYGLKIDVAAPGGGDSDPNNTIPQPHRSVLSLLSSAAKPEMTSSGILVIGGKYLRQAGTSMAAPHVAGAAALILSLHPEWSPEQVRQALHFGDDVGPTGFDFNAGYGRLNAAKALTITSPLVAQLTVPTTIVTDNCSVPVRGTAAGATFSNWRLEVGTGTNPTTWNQIASSTTQVTNGVLANWDATNSPDGSYTLHLVAQNSLGQSFEDRFIVNIDNAFITEPALYASTYSSAVRAGVVLAIKGTAAGCGFSGYDIRVRRAKDNQLLTNPAIVLTNGGSQRIIGDVLATWDTSNLPADYYQIILEVRQSNGTVTQKTTRVIIDPDLHPGWPTGLGSMGEGMFNMALVNHVDLADVDGDGTKEILIGSGSKVSLFKHNGDMLAGWPQAIDSEQAGALNQQSPAVGDIDGDGEPEVVANNNHSQLFVWHADGTPLQGWPRNLGGTIHSFSIADINGDGSTEIIAADWSGTVKVLDRNGQYLTGWPRTVSTGSTQILSAPYVADLDRDGQKEIITSNGLTLYVLRSNGAFMPGWPKQFSNADPRYVQAVNPAIGDLLGDGNLKIVIPGDGNLLAFNADGTNANGWPRPVNLTTISSPAIGDIDGDGIAEVVVGGRFVQETPYRRYAYLYAWHGDGTALPNWPVSESDRFSGEFGSAALGDLDGDGRADVIIGSQGSADWNLLRGPYSLSAYRFDGSRVSGFPKPTIHSGASDYNTVGLGDLDGDGLLELVWIDFNSNLYVWDLSASANANLPWPMVHHDAQHTGTNPISLGPIVTPTPTPTPSPVPNSIRFATLATVAGEGTTHAQVAVIRTGDSSGNASVDYHTADTDVFSVGCGDTISNAGSALGRCDFVTSVGTLMFAPGETTKTLTIPLIDDSYAEGNESFSVVLTNPIGAPLGSISTNTVMILDNEFVNGPNPIFNTDFFLRQHYLDFLSREPDLPGFSAWKNVLNNCPDLNNDPTCDRLLVSGSFFGSPEFRLKGYYVYRFYRIALNRKPSYSEIVTDMSRVTGQTPEEVFQKKAAFANNFVLRSDFANLFQSMSDGEYVTTLMGRHGLAQITTFDPLQPDGPNKLTMTCDNLIADMDTGTLSRAQVLRAIADSDEVANLEFTAAFVAMQYYGYLRRTPEVAGYNAWLSYLYANPGQFRTMVNGFMNSAEYRSRFGPSQ